MHYTNFSSPVGPLTLWGTDTALAGLWLPGGKHTPPLPAGAREEKSPFRAVLAQLDEYFAGERTAFDLPLAAEGTDFQRRVWAELRRIPFGHTMSYGSLATRIGHPKSARAVGMANGRNPISIIVPCHRVIGQDGSLIGYGGGLDAKRWLLEHEARTAPRAAGCDHLCRGGVGGGSLWTIC
jgi:methylated-DNA-[protein]-cysteine S-methyltransferase